MMYKNNIVIFSGRENEKLTVNENDDLHPPPVFDHILDHVNITHHIIHSH